MSTREGRPMGRPSGLGGGGFRTCSPLPTESTRVRDKCIMQPSGEPFYITLEHCRQTGPTTGVFEYPAVWKTFGQGKADWIAQRLRERLRLSPNAERRVEVVSEATRPDKMAEYKANLAQLERKVEEATAEANLSERARAHKIARELDEEFGKYCVEQGTTGESRRKPRVKREVAEPMIAAHLSRRPHDRAEDVVKEIGFSVGVVAESRIWKLNQERLKVARQLNIDPTAIPLNEKAINEAGGKALNQFHDHKDEQETHDGEIDAREKELFELIGQYLNEHPDPTPQEAAKACDCTAADIERYQSWRQVELNRLTAEQAESEKEDIEVPDPDAKRGKRQQWVTKQP